MKHYFFFSIAAFVFISQGISAYADETAFNLSGDGYVRTWLINGPHANPSSAEDLSGHDYDFLNEERSVSPANWDSSYVNGVWTPWNLAIPQENVFDLRNHFGDRENVTVYFFCILENSGDTQDCVFHIASNDSVKVWMDRNVIHDAKVLRDMRNWDRVPVTVEQGRHPLLVKVCQTGAGWGMGFKITSSDGKVPETMRIIIPGTIDDNEYIGNLLTFTAPPLVLKNGKRIVKCKISPVISPTAISEFTIIDREHPDSILASIGTPETETLEIPIERSDRPRKLAALFQWKGKRFKKEIELKPCRDWRVYLLPGSHVDIGYTDLQYKVLADHKKFFHQAIDLYEDSIKKGYTPDSHYIWNTEVSWAVKDYLQTYPERDQVRLLDYMRRGVITLDALYLNLLTALCGDEELVRSVYYSTHLAEREHLPEVKSAMITDVPGYTWGTVSVLAEAGVKYFQLGPNLTARIGFATLGMGSKPYYWIGPDGESKVLVWNTGYGYARIFNLLESERDKDRLLEVLAGLEADPEYPYDVFHIRAYFADNTPPPAHLSKVAHEWNQRYASPKLIISGAVKPFEDLVSKFEDQIPELKGDYTPYWEDGAASSARETAMNRISTLRLQTAEKAWALSRMAGNGAVYPAMEIDTAYDNIMLYSEHTWGAHTSITQPDSPFTREQWRVKRSFAEKGMWASSRLLRDGAREMSKQIRNDRTFAFAVWNLTQWRRNGAAVIPESGIGNELAASEQWIAVDPDGMKAPVVKRDEGYMFQVIDIPPFGYKVYELIPETRETRETSVTVSAADGFIRNYQWDVKLNKKTGAIQSLVYQPMLQEMVDSNSAYGVNQYLHVLGPNGKESKSADRVLFQIPRPPDSISTSLQAYLEGQGIHGLAQNIELFNAMDRIDICNVINKEDIREKEAVRFAFPFDVPEGQFTLETTLASMHPETDQIPGANRNIYTLRRWIDISNADFGITVVSHDVPLLELCDMHAEQPWLEHLPLTNTHFYSYAMNNYWFTNYKASQGGPATFRYSILFHDGSCTPSAATRFADEVSYPFLVTPLAMKTKEEAPLPSDTASLVSIDVDNVLAQGIKVAEDGDGFILRLRELDGVDTPVRIFFDTLKKITWERTDLVERPRGEEGASDEGVMEVEIGSREIRTYRVRAMDLF